MAQGLSGFRGFETLKAMSMTKKNYNYGPFPEFDSGIDNKVMYVLKNVRHALLECSRHTHGGGVRAAAVLVLVAARGSTDASVDALVRGPVAYA